MSGRTFQKVIILCLLGTMLFSLPIYVTADEKEEYGRYPAYITAQGNMTLTNDLSFNISIQANFTASVPIQLPFGVYNATFSGEAEVSNETIKFRGTIMVNGLEFHVSFAVPNVYPEIPIPETKHDHQSVDHEVTSEEMRPEGPPEAHFTYWPEEPKVNETVYFDASGSKPNGGEIVSYQWDFGDNATSSGVTVSHTYTKAGVYVVTLNVTDSEGFWSIASKEINVRDLDGEWEDSKAEDEEKEDEYYEPEEEYDAFGKLEITIAQITELPKEIVDIKLRGRVDQYGQQPALGWLKARAKFGQQYGNVEKVKVRAIIIPVGLPWPKEPFEAFHDANITLTGQLTLNNAVKLSIGVNFTAKVPEEIESGVYIASFEGTAYVTEESIRFRGELDINDEDFYVDFTIVNVYPTLVEGYHEATGELTVTISRITVEPLEFSLYLVELINASIVELNYEGTDFYILGQWDVYRITWVYRSEENFTWTAENIVANGTGQFNVTGGWMEFSLQISGIEMVTGKIIFLCYRSFTIPLGDVNGDYIVDIFDLVHVSLRYGTKPGELGFDFDIDLNDDFEIDIYDLTTIAAHIDEEY